MTTQDLMAPEEIHDFGVDIVFAHMKKKGYKFESVNKRLGMDPQIVSRTPDGRLVFVYVRTASYPGKGQLEEAIHSRMIDHANKFRALPYFASVGIANADTTDDAEMRIPVRGAGYHIAFEDLLLISPSDRVKAVGEDGKEDLTRAVTGQSKSGYGN